jgi:hypothetical protein
VYRSRYGEAVRDSLACLETALARITSLQTETPLGTLGEAGPWATCKEVTEGHADEDIKSTGASSRSGASSLQEEPTWAGIPVTVESEVEDDSGTEAEQTRRMRLSSFWLDHSVAAAYPGQDHYPAQ